MSNRLEYLLEAWYSQKDACEWVLATVVETKGSAYRKAGAMMLINGLGQSFGLLSGGCLEADLKRKATQCLLSNQSLEVCYDMQDDSDIAWQLGIGCGGMVKVLLQPITPTNQYLELDKLYSRLKNRESSYYLQSLDVNNSANQVLDTKQYSAYQQQPTFSDSKHFISKIKPTPSLIIFGGGLDAVPLVNMSAELGWLTTVIDCRVGYAKSHHFPKAHKTLNQAYDSLDNIAEIKDADAIVIMQHNVELDAKALAFSNQFRPKYLGLLGPTHRTQRVMVSAGLSYQELKTKLANPIGLDLGGELPESIAISILSQIHAVIENASTQSLSQKMELKSVS